MTSEDQKFSEGIVKCVEVYAAHANVSIPVAWQHFQAGIFGLTMVTLSGETVRFPIRQFPDSGKTIVAPFSGGH